MNDIIEILFEKHIQIFMILELRPYDHCILSPFAQICTHTQ